MKIRKALLVLAATAAASTVYADKIQFSQAPSAVQQAIRQKAGRQQIEDVVRDNRNGQIVYEARWRSQGGAQQELFISEAGTILRDAVGASTGLGQQNLTLANQPGVSLPETPQAVQTAIHNQIPTAPIDGIQRGIWNGQNIYDLPGDRNWTTCRQSNTRDKLAAALCKSRGPECPALGRRQNGVQCRASTCANNCSAYGQRRTHRRF